MKRSPAYLSREDWKAKFALLESQYASKAVDYQPMFPMGELEYAIAHPVPYQTISVRPTSDPEYAFRAIMCAMATGNCAFDKPRPGAVPGPSEGNNMTNSQKLRLWITSIVARTLRVPIDINSQFIGRSETRRAYEDKLRALSRPDPSQTNSGPA